MSVQGSVAHVKYLADLELPRVGFFNLIENGVVKSSQPTDVIRIGADVIIKGKYVITNVVTSSKQVAISSQKVL